MRDTHLDKLEVMLKAAFLERSVNQSKGPLLNEFQDLLYKHAEAICDKAYLESDEAKYRFKKDVVYELASVVSDYTRRLAG